MQVHIRHSIPAAVNWCSTQWSTRWRELIFWQLLLLCHEAWSFCWSCFTVPCKCLSWDCLLSHLDFSKGRKQSMAWTGSSRSRRNCNGTTPDSSTERSRSCFCASRYLHEAAVHVVTFCQYRIMARLILLFEILVWWNFYMYDDDDDMACPVVRYSFPALFI